MNLAEMLTTAANCRSELISRGVPLRLFDGAGDGLDGLVIERFHALGIAHLHAGTAAEAFGRDAIVAALVESRELLGLDSCYFWYRTKDSQDTSRSGPELLFGAAVQDLWVREDAVEFLIRPEATPSAGLFLDMRDVRAYLLAESLGKQVLNTFCFTGSLGIAAHVGGAAEVVQIDISKSILQWAKENFERNQKPGGGSVRFIADDCIEFMQREVRRLEKGRRPYDTVIIDPPSFGSSKGRTFSLVRDIGGLITLALQLLAPSGTLILTVNYSQLDPQKLRDLVENEAGEQKRGIDGSRELLPPAPDFTSCMEQSRAMRGVLVKLSS